MALSTKTSCITLPKRSFTTIFAKDSPTAPWLIELTRTTAVAIRPPSENKTIRLFVFLGASISMIKASMPVRATIVIGRMASQSI